MKKLILILFTLSLSHLSYASSEEDKLKFCLAFKYEAQVNYYNKYKKYTSQNNLLPLPSNLSDVCDGYDLKIKASKSDFLIKAMIQEITYGTINHKKVLRLTN